MKKQLSDSDFLVFAYEQANRKMECKNRKKFPPVVLCEIAIDISRETIFFKYIISYFDTGNWNLEIPHKLQINLLRNTSSDFFSCSVRKTGVLWSFDLNSSYAGDVYLQGTKMIWRPVVDDKMKNDNQFWLWFLLCYGFSSIQNSAYLQLIFRDNYSFLKKHCCCISRLIPNLP